MRFIDLEPAGRYRYQRKSQALGLKHTILKGIISVIGEKLNLPLTGKCCIQDKCHFAPGEYWWHEKSRTLYCVAEKAMAPHSSSLAWKIPWTEGPGGLPSIGLHRVGHEWSNLAAAAIVWGSPWDLFFKIKYHPMVIPAIRVKTSSFFHVRSELASCLSIICIYLSIHLSVYHVYWSTHCSIVSIYLCICLSIDPSTYLFIHPSIDLSFLSVCLTICLSIWAALVAQL